MIDERIPEPTKTAFRAHQYFHSAKYNSAQISRIMKIKESDVLAMINHVRAWIVQEDNRAA